MSEPAQVDQSPHKGGTQKFWDGKFVFTVVILLLIALLAAYLEYSYYPSVLASIGETNLSLHVSFLTFQYDATRGSENVPGIPSLDFFQIFLIGILLLNLSRYLERRAKKHD